MKNIFLLLVVCFLLGACKKNDIGSLAFDVSTSGLTFSVMDTVAFQFTGNPDNITFYSGEPGHNFANRNRTKVAGIPQLDFTSFIKNGTQTNSLQLLASTDFTGVYDSANVVNATWADITGRAVLSTGLDNTPSGPIDLSDFVVSGKPIFLAFRYTGKAGSTQRAWVFRSFNVINRVPDEPSFALANINNAGWLAISIKGPAKWTIAADLVRFDGPTGTSTVANEDYIITKALYPDKVNPDVGVALKNMSTYLPGYTYHFDTPGTYKIAFVASNIHANGERSVVRELTLTITP